MKKISFFLLSMLLSFYCIGQIEIWGTTLQGGSMGAGALFKYLPYTDTLIEVYNYSGPGGSNPNCNITLASNGLFYGIGTSANGTLYSFNVLNQEASEIHWFGNGYDGSLPNGELVDHSSGRLFGVTPNGGVYGQGTLFEYNYSTNTYQVKINFNNELNCNMSNGSLIEGNNGKLYGMCVFGGTNDCGCIYEYDPVTENMEIVYNFGNLGRNPRGTLIHGSDGCFYGMTQLGGIQDCGTIFKFDYLNENLTFLYNLEYTITGVRPYGELCEANNGKFYAMTYEGGAFNSGVFFEFDPSDNTCTKLVDFDILNTGSNPMGGITQGIDGKLYGTTYTGGYYNVGVLFSYDLNTATFNKLRDFNSENGAYPYFLRLKEFYCTEMFFMPKSKSVSHQVGTTSTTLYTLHDWTIADFPDWVDVTPLSGSGTTPINVSYDDNIYTDQRLGVVQVVSGDLNNTFVLRQQGAPPFIFVNPSNYLADTLSGSFNANITANCHWLVEENSDWIGVTPSGGIHNGLIAISYGQNVSAYSRNGIVTFDGEGMISELSITQNGAAPFLQPDQTLIEVVNFAGTVNFAIQSNQNWQIEFSDDWLEVFPMSGYGSQTITINYQENFSLDDRSTMISLVGDFETTEIEFVQLGAPEFINLELPAINVTGFPQSHTMIIESNVNWNVDVQCDWVTVNPSTGIGITVIEIIIQPNPNTTNRSCLIFFNGIESSAQLSVNQSGDQYIFVDPTFINLSSSPGSLNLNLITNETWTLSCGCNWLSVVPQSGVGIQTLAVSYEFNSLFEPRQCVVNISGQVVSEQILIEQEGTSVGVKEISGYDLKVFPIPASDYLTIEGAFGNCTIRIYNNIGQPFKTFLLEKDQTIIDISDLKSGIYYLQLNSEQNIKTLKFNKF